MVSHLTRYWPKMEQIAEEDKEKFVSMVGADSNPKDMLKSVRKVLLNLEDKDGRHIVIKYMQMALLAYAMLGTTELRFQALQLIKIIGTINSEHLFVMLTQLTTGDHLRNCSELVDFMSYEQLKSYELHKFFVDPLVLSFSTALNLIITESFTIKWLDTFIEIGRSLNNLMKGRPDIIKDQKTIIIKIKYALDHISVLRRDIITQLFISLLILNKYEPLPKVPLAQIHYLHAKSVLYDEPALERLLTYTTMLDTEAKYHLLHTLLHSIDKEFKKCYFKDTVFDKIIILFEVGRASYNPLEQIIRIIVNYGGKWSIDGYLSRKFFVAKCIIKTLEDTRQVVAVWPTLLRYSLQESGNLNLPFAVDCAELLLQFMYKECEEDAQFWIAKWLPYYLKFLTTGQKLTVKGLIEYVNPMVCKICPKPVLLQKLLYYDELKRDDSGNLQLAIISLLQCYRLEGLIEPREPATYEYKGDLKVSIDSKKMVGLLLSSNPNIALKAFEFLTISHKPSDLIQPFEYQAMLYFYKYGVVTSNTDYRRCYISATKKLFERLRTVYYRELVPQKKAKTVKMFYNFRDFIKYLLEECFNRLYPDCPFEVANPSLEIISLAFNYFGHGDFEVRKGTIVKGTTFLKDIGMFTYSQFNSLVVCMSSSYENIRLLSYNIMKMFPREFKVDVVSMWNKSLELTNSLVIRRFEAGSRLMCYLSDRYHEQVPIDRKYEDKALNLVIYLLKILKERYEVFARDFASQSKVYYSNLVHGIATCLSYLFDGLVEAQLKEYWREVMNELFAFLQQVLSFAVYVSCANVSTVVLDSSQSKLAKDVQKMKVDCRGHFIQEGVLNSVYKMLNNGTLMTSVEEDYGLENTLVVSFYLLTRECGLFFQSVARLSETEAGNSILPYKSLRYLVYTFFYALVNLKHMGSVDRIAKGLQKMCKVLYKQSSKVLSELPEELLSRLLYLLEESKFTNILRRSAGVPYAFSCLLKSEALKKRHLVYKTFSTLFSLAQADNKISNYLRIHSLNILKKLFQDGDLRFELDQYVSYAFIISIKGFSTYDWGVRNSSLMLFSALCLRTLGPKPDMNILQFFQKCPSLMNYFMYELHSYIKVKSMYPTLYPIALLLSRLSPYEQSTLMVRDGEAGKIICKYELDKFIPLLIEAGNTPNYMGRVIIGKALLPFLQFNKILRFCSELLGKLYFGKNNNKIHNILLIVYHLIISYYEIQEKQQQSTYITTQEEMFFEQLAYKISHLQYIKCPLVEYTIIKIALHFIQKRQHIDKNKFNERFQPYARYFLQKGLYGLDNFRFKEDLGHSVLRLAAIRLNLYLQNSLEPYRYHLIYVSQKDGAFWKKVDTEVIEVFLINLRKTLKNSKTHDAEIEKIVLDLAFRPYVSTNIQAQLLRIVRIFKSKLTYYQIEYLKSRIGKHEPLKIAIFKLLQQQYCDMIDLVYLFSRSDQLTRFRELAAYSIKAFDERMIPAYVRLLQDEDMEIRRYTAYKLGNILGLGCKNYNWLIEVLFSKATAVQIVSILRDGDYDIKKRNDQEYRIFSFDKTNKYRSDITNLLSLLGNHQSKQYVSEQILNGEKETDKILKQYIENPLDRNEYRFEVALRHLIFLKSQGKICEEMARLEPIFNKIRSV